MSVPPDEQIGALLIAPPLPEYDALGKRVTDEMIVACVQQAWNRTVLWYHQHPDPVYGQTLDGDEQCLVRLIDGPRRAFGTRTVILHIVVLGANSRDDDVVVSMFAHYAAHDISKLFLIDDYSFKFSIQWR